MSNANDANDANDVKYGYCLATCRTEDSQEDLDGYMGIFHNKKSDESKPVDEDVTNILSGYNFYLADENHIEIPKGQLLTLTELIENHLVLKSLIKFNVTLQKDMSEYDGVYDFDFFSP